MTNLLSERARVLHAALGRSTFTAEELAADTSTKDATVRTILFRSKSMVQEVEESDAAMAAPRHEGPSPRARRAGRRSKRYRLRDSARELLASQLAELTVDLRPSVAARDTSSSLDTALLAAESSLHFAEDPSQNDGLVWRERASLQANAARRLLPGVHDAAKRARFEARLYELDKSLASPPYEPSPQAAPRFPWLDRFRQLLPSFEPDALFATSASSFPIVHFAAHRAVPDQSEPLSCLWFDATEGRVDSWREGIVQSLRGARCTPFQIPVRRVVDTAGAQSRWQHAMADLPSRVMVFITVCSRERTAGAKAIELIRGPLHPILRVTGRMATAPSVTVMDHDLPNDPFWLDHRIANLRYYPTAQPMLAHQLAEQAARNRLMHMPKDFVPKPLLGDHLTSAAADLGFAALELYSRRLNEPHRRSICLLGVNRGGYLLAKMLWKRELLQADYLVKCECYPASGLISFGEQIPHDVSSFIIVDDIIRTGRTINIVRDYLNRHHSSQRQSTLALAAVSPGYSGGSLPYDIDFCAWISQNRDLKFPWSDIAEENPNPSAFLDATGVNQVGEWLTSSTGDVP